MTLDGDLQNDPRDIPLLLRKIEEGYQVVSGWRRERKDPYLTRQLPSILFIFPDPELIPSLGIVVIGSGPGIPYGPVFAPSSFGPGGGLCCWVSSSGPPVGVHPSPVGPPTGLILPEGYSSGTPLSSSATFSGQTISGLGMTPGTYVTTWGSGPNMDSYTLNVVPEPTAVTLVGIGSLLLLTIRRRNQRR